MKEEKKTNRLLAIFFAVTLGWTWSFGFLPILIGIDGTGLGTFLFYFGGGAPSVTALFIVFVTYDRQKRKDYFKRCFSIKGMGIMWPLITILFFVAITLVGLGISVGLMGEQMPGMDYIHLMVDNPLYIPLILLISLISGPLNEEFGWRGFALEPLMRKFGFVGGSLILGFGWGIWHLPWYFTPGQAQYELLKSSVVAALMFIPSVMLLSVVVSFVYVKTGRSIMAGAFVHMMGNLINGQLLLPYSTQVGTVVRYTKIGFCLIVSLYCVFSNRFKKEFHDLVRQRH